MKTCSISYIKAKNFRTNNFRTVVTDFGQGKLNFRTKVAIITKNAKEKNVKITVCLIIAAISILAFEKDPPSLAPTN